MKKAEIEGEIFRVSFGKKIWKESLEREFVKEGSEEGEWKMQARMETRAI